MNLECCETKTKLRYSFLLMFAKKNFFTFSLSVPSTTLFRHFPSEKCVSLLSLLVHYYTLFSGGPQRFISIIFKVYISMKEETRPLIQPSGRKNCEALKR